MPTRRREPLLQKGDALLPRWSWERGLSLRGDSTFRASVAKLREEVCQGCVKHGVLPFRHAQVAEGKGDWILLLKDGPANTGRREEEEK